MNFLHFKEEQIVKFISEWIQYYGPVTLDFISRSLGINNTKTRILIDDLLETRQLIEELLIKGRSFNLYCDAENFETLPPISRSASSPIFEPLEIKNPQLFLATIQGLTKRGEDNQNLSEILDQLIGFHANVSL